VLHVAWYVLHVASVQLADVNDQRPALGDSINGVDSLARTPPLSKPSDEPNAHEPPAELQHVATALPVRAWNGIRNLMNAAIGLAAPGGIQHATWIGSFATRTRSI
jgi:hypothetical protein